MGVFSVSNHSRELAIKSVSGNTLAKRSAHSPISVSLVRMAAPVVSSVNRNTDPGTLKNSLQTNNNRPTEQPSVEVASNQPPAPQTSSDTPNSASPPNNLPLGLASWGNVRRKNLFLTYREGSGGKVSQTSYQHAMNEQNKASGLDTQEKARNQASESLSLAMGEMQSILMTGKDFRCQWNGNNVAHIGNETNTVECIGINPNELPSTLRSALNQITAQHRHSIVIEMTQGVLNLRTL